MDSKTPLRVIFPYQEGKCVFGILTFDDQNFYYFVVPLKLNRPGVIHTHQGTEKFPPTHINKIPVFDENLHPRYELVIKGGEWKVVQWSGDSLIASKHREVIGGVLLQKQGGKSNG